MEMHRVVLVIMFLSNLHVALSQVGVVAHVDTYWGYDGDAELMISVEVSAEESWDTVTVTVVIPDGTNVPAVTEDVGNATFRTYSHVIKSLFIDDAGVYTFMAVGANNETGSTPDSADVTVYIYTVEVLPTLANYHAVERDTQITVEIYVTTEGIWNDVTVTAIGPNGETYPTTFTETSLPFWRLYSASITDVITGTFNITATEALGGINHSVVSQAVVEVHAPTLVDEYLYRIGVQSSNITSNVADFYNYRFDGPDDTYILDGGNDMYDRGNYVTVSSYYSSTPSSTTTISHAAYGQPYTTPNYIFSSKTVHPFLSLMWITNADNLDDTFTIQATGTTGTNGLGMSSTSEDFGIRVNNYHGYAQAVQIYEGGDPSICEVYFWVSNEDSWSSIAPTSIGLRVNGFPPTSSDNLLIISGGNGGNIQNVLVGYTLLSKSTGEQVQREEIQAVLTSIVQVVEEKDGFTISSDAERIVEPGVESLVLTARVATATGDWTGKTVMVTTPSSGSSVLSTFTTIGNARIYQYSLSMVTEVDAGSYSFSATDSYDTTIIAETILNVYTTTVITPTPEYWAVDNDPELIISVEVTADNWTDVTVMVIRPDQSIHEVFTAGTNETRVFTHSITSLFIADAGNYSFVVYRSGLVSSADGVVTVYLFTVSLYPDVSDYHVVERDTTVTMLVYVGCDGDWNNVEVSILTPHAGEVQASGVPASLPHIRMYNATITDVINGFYNITAVETLGTRSVSKSVLAVLEVHNSSYVDEYLYRFGVASDQIVSLVPGWNDYWYDGSDNTYILDGGSDMYDRGNYISFASSAGGETNVPYGKPFVTNNTAFSTKHFYPFVALMWINNEDQMEQEFSISVEGKTGTGGSGMLENYNRTIFEFSYEVSYEVVQVYGATDPSICEVYFSISNLYIWNSVKPATFDVAVGGFPTDSLMNTARLTGSPSNVMLGYTLLSKSNGSAVLPVEVERVVEKLVAIISEKDEFSVQPNSEDGVFTGVLGESVVIGAVVTSNGQWDGVVVKVTKPDGTIDDVTDFTTDNLHTRRIYEYTILNADISDNGKYTFVATDAYQIETETLADLYVFSATSAPTEQTDYPVDVGDSVNMEIYIITTSNAFNWGTLVVTIDTPNKGTLNVNNWTADHTTTRVYRHIIQESTVQDTGNYTFRVREMYEGRSTESTVGTNVGVLSIGIDAPITSYSADEGAEVLQIPVEITTQGNWADTSIVVETPGRGEQEVTEYETLSASRRTYTYTFRDVSTEDSGTHTFRARETLLATTRIESAYIEVIVKGIEPKFSPGEIAGIVIGSVAGAAILGGILYYGDGHFWKFRSALFRLTFALPISGFWSLIFGLTFGLFRKKPKKNAVKDDVEIPTEKEKSDLTISNEHAEKEGAEMTAL